MVGGIPRPLRLVATAGAIFLGGMFTLSLASSATIRLLQAATEAKWVICSFMLIGSTRKLNPLLLMFGLSNSFHFG